MISKGSCGTDDWSNNAENTDLYYSNKLLVTYIHILIISQYYVCIIDQINAALMSIYRKINTASVNTSLYPDPIVT